MRFQGFKANSVSLGLLVLLGFIWGSGYTLAKFAMTHGVMPLGYAFWQSLGPALLVTGFIFLTRQGLPYDKAHLRYYAITGFLGIALPNTNMYFVAAHLPAGILAVIVNTVPILTYPLALAFRLERFQWLRCIGVIAGVLGILSIVGLSQALIAGHLNLWACLALISPLSFACAALYIHKKRPQGTAAISLTAGMLGFSTLFLLPLMIAVGGFYPLTLSFSPAEGVILLEIILSSAGYILFFILIARAGPVYYSLVGGIVALTGLFWGFIIYQERLTSSDLYATLVILLALVLVSFPSYQRNKQ